VRSETVEDLLESLASPGAGPGGRVGGALHAALGAALVARVARSGGGRAGGGTASGADPRTRTAQAADAHREVVLRLADDHGGDSGTADTARRAVQVIEVAERVLTVAETLRPTGDRTSACELAAAAEALRAAVGAGRVEVEVDLVGIADPAVREELLLALDPVDDVVLRAAKLTAGVREQLLR
jgi:methenyltetrahydrofolate cyclohydrolase